MGKRHHRWGDESGHALLVVMILVFSLCVVGSAFLSLAGHETVASQATLDSERAFWLAEAGKERAILTLSGMFSPPTQDTVLFDEVAGPDGGSYSVQCRVDTTALWDVEKAFVLDCVGRSRGIERRIRQRVKMTSFALYAMFTDNETINGMKIWHVTGDVIEGPLHTNGSFCLYGSPQFLGRVTSASDHMTGYPHYYVDDMNDWPVGENDPYFAEGGELNVAQIPLPTETQDLEQLSLTGGVFASSEIDLELGMRGDDEGVEAPGWFRYKDQSDHSGNWNSVSISSMSNKVFYCEDDIRVKGVLDGELTISSHRDVYIVDDITYLGSDGQGAPQAGCDDLLGIVAERNVFFADTGPNQNDLIVDAVLMALDTSIAVEGYDSGDPRGTLTIHGGLIQKYRGPVGQIRYGVIIHGYQKSYHYDPRVTARTPPFFPQTGIYEETSWEETWDESDPFS